MHQLSSAWLLLHTEKQSVYVCAEGHHIQTLSAQREVTVMSDW